jgi:hypothetical protein
MLSFGKHASATPVVMVVDRSGIHRAKALRTTWVHYQGCFRLQLLPARAGHYLDPIEGFWRVMKDTLGVGRCLLTYSSCIDVPDGCF